MKMRLLLVLALLAAVCGAGFGSATAKQETVVEIYFPIAVDSPVTEILEGYATTYEADHPGVDIVFSYEGGYNDVKNKLITTQEGGGDLPALAILLAADIYDLRNAEVVQPWDAFVTEDYLADFAPAWLANSYYDYDYDGTPELYGIPFQRSTVLLYYNATLLEENSLTPPTTWDELSADAQALTTDARTGILLNNSWPYWVFQPFAIGAGTNIVSESDVEVTFNDPNVIAALQYWLDLASAGATPAGAQDTWGDAPGQFANGDVAMMIHSTGSLPSVLKNATFEVGVSAVPGRDGDFATVTGGGNLYLVAGTDEATAQAAFDFVQWLTTPDMAADWSINTGYLPTRISALETEAWTTFVADNPQFADAAATMDVAGREFSVQSLAQVRDILHAHILAVLNGEEEPGDAMEAAQTDADAILSVLAGE